MARITEMVQLQHKFLYIGYLLLPVILLFKLCLVGGVLYIGLYLFQNQVNYKNCLKITLIAELVSIIAMLIKTLWLMIDKPATAEDIQSFSPLSLTQLLHINNLPKYLFYPLQLFNVFEVAYWLILAFGIMAFTQQKWGKSLKTVAYSYGMALLMWTVFVVFIQIQFS